MSAMNMTMEINMHAMSSHDNNITYYVAPFTGMITIKLTKITFC